MPARKTTRSSRTLNGPNKRSKKGVSNRSRQTVKVPRYITPNATGFPKQITIKHKYVETQTLSTGTSDPASATYAYSCNGMFDPRFAVGGHQPLYFDQAATIYNHYVVTAATCIVDFYVETPGQVTCGIVIDDDGTATYNTLSSLCEHPGAKYATITGNSSGTQVVANWSLAQHFGKSAQDSTAFRGSAAANPTEQQFFQVFYRGTEAVDAKVAHIIVTIYYTATWKEINDIAGS